MILQGFLTVPLSRYAATNVGGSSCDPLDAGWEGGEPGRTPARRPGAGRGAPYPHSRLAHRGGGAADRPGRRGLGAGASTGLSRSPQPSSAVPRVQRALHGQGVHAGGEQRATGGGAGAEAALALPRHRGVPGGAEWGGRTIGGAGRESGQIDEY